MMYKVSGFGLEFSVDGYCIKTRNMALARHLHFLLLLLLL